MRNKILTILIIGSLIFTIAYLPPSIKAFTNIVSIVGGNGNVYNCATTCNNPVIIAGFESTLNDLIVIQSICTTGNAITSVTDNSSPSQIWTLDKAFTYTTPQNIELPTNVLGTTTFSIEYWSTTVTQVATITIHVNYASTNSGCMVMMLEGNVNTPIFNNFNSRTFALPNPANNIVSPYTTTIAPSGSAVNNYLVIFSSIYGQTAAQSGFNAFPNSCTSACNTPIVGTNSLIPNTGVIYTTTFGSNLGTVAGVGYLFSSTGASATIGTQIQSASYNAGGPILTVGVLFATSGSVANCNSLVCNISEAIPFTEGFGSLGNLVVQLADSIPFQEFTNFAHSLIVRLTDGFTFLEQIPLVGPIFAQQIKDSFRLLDSLCIITFSCSFVTFTQPTPRTYVLYDNPIDFFVTIFMIPAIAIIGIIFLMRRGAEIPEHMVMPLLLFAVLMIAWGGANTIFPASVSLLVILIAGAALSYYIADWFYGRFNKGAIETE